jgi:methylase of polypeptide subunit release factors
MSFQPFVSVLFEALAETKPLAARLGLSDVEAYNALVVGQLRDIAKEFGQQLGAPARALSAGRLFRSAPGFEVDRRAEARERLLGEAESHLAALAGGAGELSVEGFGQLYESLLAARPSGEQHHLRKRTGSYYTPEALTRVVAERAFAALDGVVDGGVAARPLRILDPALGAGAFLVRAGREAAERSGRSLSELVRHELYGADISPLAVAVAEVSLWRLAADPELSLADAGRHLREGDALCTPAAARALGRGGVDFTELSPQNFDLVIGNPPWVAFAGRATQPLPTALREHYRKSFRGFRGYPTLHALFVELSARLAPQGVVALLIPSPVADLDGYRPVRRALAESHAVKEPLLELGQDAFAAVTQPCFALVAAPRTAPESDPSRSYVLTERRRAASAASELQTPVALARLAHLPRFPAELFGEMGLQTNSRVTKQLLYRGTSPPKEYSYALLEGRNIAEFALSPPRLFLKPDRAFLSAQRCRLREVSDYARVKLVVRQTAAIPIAAAHDGTPFRNSLLAGFELPEFPAALTLGLLNSTLYRALHLAGRRDARQGAFPQVKVGHLRSLPAPPPRNAPVAELAARASESGLTPELREALDAAVFALFDITPNEAAEIDRFVRSLAPRAGLTTP